MCGLDWQEKGSRKGYWLRRVYIYKTRTRETM